MLENVSLVDLNPSSTLQSPQELKNTNIKALVKTKSESFRAQYLYFSKLLRKFQCAASNENYCIRNN